ncbi:MAG: NHLP bacteriocin export ABC transporter permease/ATPase subunit [Clostridia bacterium]|nr:NHLP bacteriocin export ABC transporter permease/ATPase subunit [Clostridia bacterium]
MGWFSEQIDQRAQSDQNILEDSLFRMASVVMDKWAAVRMEDERLIAREALDEILKFYHQKAVEIPDDIRDVDRQLEYALRPLGLMTREVHLESGWWHDAYGPMLGCLRESGATVALLPGHLFGYYYRDPATGKRVRVSRRNAGLFAREALCFYRPLPMRKLGVRDLLLHMKNSISHGDLLLIILATLTVTVIGMVEPAVYNVATGSVLRSRSANLLLGIAAFLIGSAVAAELVGMVRSLLFERISTKTSMGVEASVMMRLLSLPVSFFRKFSSGELSSRADAVGSLCGMLLNSILSVGLESLLSLIYVSQIFAFAPGLVWPALLIVLATVTLSISVSLVQIGVSRKKMKLEAEENGMSYAVMGAIQKIRLSGSEKRVFARWGRLYSRAAQLEYNPPAFLKLGSVMTTAISLTGTVIIYWIAIRTGVSDHQYIAFSAAYGRVMTAFTALAGIATSIATVKPVLEMAEPILSAEPEVSAEKEAVSQLSGNIEMSHVSFRYDEGSPYILHDLSLRIRAGEYVAIVGRTGCGKSTLVRLLLGFEKPERGAIFYDRHDLNSVDPRSLRRQIGVVIQNGDLFQGDIFSNITISAPQLTLDEAWAAAEVAGVAQDIREMPMGMQTIISEGQGGISGGQKQRLMIARAVAPKPKILILDEATSALDNKTQKQVSDALDALQCTRLVIAHRLSTIRNCDRILVMDQGAIIEEGTYDELIARKGYFADLVARQRLDRDEPTEVPDPQQGGMTE